jgi:DNA-dependent RNA polymerase auxiliary subunit epsilon
MGNMLGDSWKDIWDKGHSPFLYDLNNSPIPLSDCSKTYIDYDLNDKRHSVRSVAEDSDFNIELLNSIWEGYE